MSSILFHFPDGDTLQIAGSERAHFGILAEDFSRGMLGLAAITKSALPERLQPFINPAGRMGTIDPQTKQWDHVLSLCVSTMGFSGEPDVFTWKGQGIRMSSLIWNTMLAAGSDPMRLGVKIHCTCEHHGYLMGFHRKWFADIIDEGLEEGLFRKGYWRSKNPLQDLGLETEDAVLETSKAVYISQGWVELSAKLREENVGPVVMSFSGGDSFPNPEIGAWMPTWPEGTPRKWDALTPAQRAERSDQQEQWGYLSFDKRWAMSVKGIKNQSGNKPIDPKTLRAYRFTHEISLLDLINQDVKRIEKGLAQQ
jgi:hypothetical protein